MKKQTTKYLTIAAAIILGFFYIRRRSGGGNGGGGNGNGEVVYLHAKDAQGFVGVHYILDKETGANMGSVNYDPDVYALVSGKIYQYMSSGAYSATLKTSWSSWPDKPANTRAVTLQILSGNTTGNINGVAFEFKVV